MIRIAKTKYGDIAYELNIKKMKNLNIKVTKNKITINSSPFFTISQIESILEDQYPKLLKAMEKLKQEYQEGETIPYLGKPYTIQYTNKEAYIKDQFIYLNQNNPHHSLQQFYYQHAFLLFKERIAYYCKQYPYLPNPILRIRYMKTMFGNCYFKRNLITLNPIILKYDIDIIDSIIIHELCHFLVPSHSKQFYHEIEKIMPDYKKRRKILKGESGIL